MKKIIGFILILGFVVGCKEKSALEVEVIAIHDEVMPKMGDMYKARKELRAIMEKTADESEKSVIIKLINDLVNADEGMMTWMHEWKVPNKEPEKTDYLLKEKERITKVKNDMLSSLENANAYIAKNSSK
ncbi:MAG: hypothetical protein AAGA77_08785 [Bacteroidota bacterium]